MTYDSAQLPDENRVITLEQCEGKVKSFTGECHSTVDFNGIVCLGTDSLTFVPMGQVAVYLGEIFQ
ncbi:MAG: hypothetical protein K2K72_07140 [Duncaniella sp.]|nr:hypothetical protein [Duncaniella sp.]